MWFIFGFISLFSFIIYGIYKRINASWKGTRKKYKGKSYKYNIINYKNKVIKIALGIDAIEGYDYALKKESFIDRFFKKIGISNEYQTGNAEFDNNVYIVSDDDYLNNQLSSNEEIIKIILKIFSFDGNNKCKIKKIRHCSGQLWIEFKTKGKVEDNIVSKIAPKFIPLLENFNNELKKQTNNINKKRDPFIIKASVILAVSTGLAINGFIHLFRLIYVDLPFIIDTKALLADSILVGSIIILILISFTLFLLKRSSRTHMILIELVIIGYFGAVSTSYIELRNLNIELNQSIPEVYNVKVLYKSITRSSKSPDSHYLHVKDWNKTNKYEKIKVSKIHYNKFHKNQYINIYQKNGYLDYKWVYKIN